MLVKNNSQKKFQKAWVLLSCLIALTMILRGCGQAPRPQIYRVGVLSGLGRYFASAGGGFKAQMAELGYVEGERIIYDVQETTVDIEAYKSITQKFVADNVDLIFSFPTEASMEAKAATQGTDIPVVFALAFTDVAGINLIDSIREPGGNITGVRFPSVEIASKRMEVLVEMAPDAKRLLVTYLNGYPNVPGQLDAIDTLAESAGITLVKFGTTSPEGLQA